jgi:hypothetical protein
LVLPGVPANAAPAKQSATVAAIRLSFTQNSFAPEEKKTRNRRGDRELGMRLLKTIELNSSLTTIGQR